MGQAVSAILRCICGEAEDEERPLCEPNKPISQAISLAISPCNFTTNGALQQTLLTSSPTSGSCNDSSPNGSLVPLCELDLHEESVKNGELHDQESSLVSQQWLDLDPLSDWPRFHGGFQQDVQICSPRSESLSISSTSSPFDSAIVGGDTNCHEVSEEETQLVNILSLSGLKLEEPKEEEEDHDHEEENDEEDEEDSDDDDDDDDYEGEERKEEKISRGMVIKERWIKHYSSGHKILLVGEGDFSFSASLAVAFGSATNMLATSLNPSGFLSRNYGNAMFNIQTLRDRGCMVMHGVDATKMADHLFLQGMTFDRIIFNFPLAGFFPDESRKSQLRRNKELVLLFLVNAKKMIREEGEIHIAHKCNGFFREWNLKLMGSSIGLRHTEEVHFNYTDYPGYRTKYGFGGDKNFNCNPSKTYKFRL